MMRKGALMKVVVRLILSVSIWNNAHPIQNTLDFYESMT